MRQLAPLIISLSVASLSSGQTPNDEIFEKKIRPILAERCYACHGEKVQMGGLQLSSAAGLKKAAESGIIVASDPDNSRILQALSWSEKLRMPPSGKLAAAEIAEIRNWIASGAPVPAEAAPISAKTQTR